MHSWCKHMDFQFATGSKPESFLGLADEHAASNTKVASRGRGDKTCSQSNERGLRPGGAVDVTAPGTAPYFFLCGRNGVSFLTQHSV